MQGDVADKCAILQLSRDCQVHHLPAITFYIGNIYLAIFIYMIDE